MTPAMPSASTGSAMRSVSGSSTRSTWSSVTRRSPAAARRTTMRRSWTAASIERVGRLAELEHHVVAGVDDVAHRAHPGGLEAHLDLVRRRPDAEPADDAADEPGAQLGLEDLDREAVGRGDATLDELDLGEAHGRPGGRRDLAGEADEAQRVAAVRLHVDVEDRVPVELRELLPDRRPGRQDEDPVRVGGQAELVARAEHAVADDAHLLGPVDPSAAGQHRAGQGDRHALAGRDVRGAAHDRQRLAVAHPDRGERSRSALGCLATVRSSPTTTCCQSAPQRSRALTSIPSTVSRSARRSGVRSRST